MPTRGDAFCICFHLSGVETLFSLYWDPARRSVPSFDQFCAFGTWGIYGDKEMVKTAFLSEQPASWCTPIISPDFLQLNLRNSSVSTRKIHQLRADCRTVRDRGSASRNLWEDDWNASDLGKEFCLLSPFFFRIM